MSQPNSPDTASGQATPLPYAGIRVVEFTHMVMGPSCGMMLADLGAEVIKIEPVGHGRDGDATRKLLGSGSGFFPLFNRNKKRDRKSTRLNSSHLVISYAVFCLKKKKNDPLIYTSDRLVLRRYTA